MKSFKEWLNGCPVMDSFDDVAQEYGKYCAEEALKKAKPEQDKGEFHYRRFVPKSGDYAFHIGASGSIHSVIFSLDIWSKAQCLYRLKTGNVFRTKEDAEYHLRMIDLAHEVKQLSFDPDWSEDAYRLTYNHACNQITCESYRFFEDLRTYFATEDIAEQAMALFPSHDDFIYCLREGLV